MADDHVHQQSQRQRDGPDDERRDELERRDDDVEERRHARGEQRVLEEVLRALLDAGVDEGHVADEREQQRNGDDRRAGDVQERDDACQVEEQDHEEHRREDRQEPLAVLLAEEVLGDVDPDEVETHLDEALEASRNDLHAAGAEREDEHDRRRRQELDQVDARDRDARDREQDVREELRDGGSVELAAVFGGLGDQCRSLGKQRWLQLRGTGEPGRRWSV